MFRPPFPGLAWREAPVPGAFLTQALESEAAGLEILAAVTDYLRRAAHEPELRFQAPEPA